MKFEVYCISCQKSGPRFKTTPAGLAFGSVQNQVAWPRFLQAHVDCDDSQFGLRTCE